MHCSGRALIIGRQQIPAGVIRREECRRVRWRHRSLQSEPATSRIDPETGYRWCATIPNIQCVPVWTDREYRRSACSGYVRLTCQLAGVGVHRERDNLVIVLQTNVEKVRHLSPSLGFSLAAALCGEGAHRASLSVGYAVAAQFGGLRPDVDPV